MRVLDQSGFRGFSFEGPTVSVRQARENLPDGLIRIGNVPAAQTLLASNPEEVERESLEALEEGVDFLAPACGVPMFTPDENMIAMRTAVEKFRAERRLPV
jgi:[methyl-Co(III) methanol-specific corrinoid protein]:coenzyme M methyltransferase